MDAPADAATRQAWVPLAPGEALAALAAELIAARQTILPKRLGAPAPDAAQLQQIIGAAGQAPDHGSILPWRLVLVPQSERPRLADAFAAALLARDASATPEQAAQAREKAYRAPVLLLVAVDGERGDPRIDLNERLISAGCAVQNMLLMATALGYGSALTSGKALKDAGLRQLFGLGAGEHALCFLSLGTVQSRKRARVRPVPADYLSVLGPQGAAPPFNTTP